MFRWLLFLQQTARHICLSTLVARCPSDQMPCWHFAHSQCCRYWVGSHSMHEDQCLLDIWHFYAGGTCYWVAFLPWQHQHYPYTKNRSRLNTGCGIRASDVDTWWRVPITAHCIFYMLSICCILGVPVKWPLTINGSAFSLWLSTFWKISSVCFFTWYFNTLPFSLVHTVASHTKWACTAIVLVCSVLKNDPHALVHVVTLPLSLVHTVLKLRYYGMNYCHCHKACHIKDIMREDVKPCSGCLKRKKRVKAASTSTSFDFLLVFFWQARFANQLWFLQFKNSKHSLKILTSTLTNVGWMAPIQSCAVKTDGHVS